MNCVYFTKTKLVYYLGNDEIELNPDQDLIKISDIYKNLLFEQEMYYLKPNNTLELTSYGSQRLKSDMIKRLKFNRILKEESGFEYKDFIFRTDRDTQRLYMSVFNNIICNFGSKLGLYKPGSSWELVDGTRILLNDKEISELSFGVITFVKNLNLEEKKLQDDINNAMTLDELLKIDISVL